MLSGIHVFCFFATCAIIVLGLEISRLFFRMPVRLVVMLGIAAFGFVAQTLYLGHRAWTATLPLSTWHDWFLVAAWILVAAYLGITFSRPATMIGVFLLPVVIGLMLVAAVAPRTAPFHRDQALLAWGVAHGVMLLFGTVTVSLGFVAGVMYLVQSWRLKNHVSPRSGLKLPSLEWLQAINKQALIFSSFFIALGLVAGIILNTIKARAHSGGLPWTDSVVVSSAILLVWLLIATAFEWLYKPAQQGRKVAYLTVASFLFLALVMAVLVAGGSRHAQAEVGIRRSEVGVQGSGGAAAGGTDAMGAGSLVLSTRYLVPATRYSVLGTPYTSSHRPTDQPTNRPTDSPTDLRLPTPDPRPPAPEAAP